VSADRSHGIPPGQLADDDLRRELAHLHETRHDTVLAGQQIKAGEKVVMYFGAANRDPAAFERPETLDLSRDPNPHIAFGTGPHGCLGQHIARIEIDAMLVEVLTRMGDFELPSAPEWLPSNFISGPKSMPLRFNRRSPSA